MCGGGVRWWVPLSPHPPCLPWRVCTGRPHKSRVTLGGSFLTWSTRHRTCGRRPSLFWRRGGGVTLAGLFPFSLWGGCSSPLCVARTWGCFARSVACSTRVVRRVCVIMACIRSKALAWMFGVGSFGGSRTLTPLPASPLPPQPRRRTKPVLLQPKRNRVALYHEHNPVLSVDSWAGAEKLHEFYLKETARRKALGLPTY